MSKIVLKCAAFLLIPLLSLPVVILYPSEMGRCGYVLIIMTLLWVTELIHLSVTAMLPMILFPLLGILDSETVSMKYLTNTGVLFLGGMIIAKSIEYSELHRRISLTFLKLCGTKGPRLILSFMIPAWFMSMWITNIAATAMVYSIANGMINDLEGDQEFQPDEEESNISITEETQLLGEQKNRSLRQLMSKDLQKAICLSIAYAATCGGIATLIGTGPNVILYGLITDRYGDRTSLNFGSYLLFGFPISLVCMLCSWLVICLIFIGPKNIWGKSFSERQTNKINNFINERYEKLGPIRFNEGSCIFWIAVLVILLVTREPGVPLWGSLFRYSTSTGSMKSFATDTQPVMFVAIILMIWPSKNIFRKRFWSNNSDYAPLLPWNVVQKEVPWNVIILIGGGFALAEGLKQSGLSRLIGSQINAITTFSNSIVILVIIASVCLGTEFVSNNVMSTIMIPILLSMTECSNTNPLTIVIPAAVASSLAFCLPISTPPNALVFSEGRVGILDMIKTGVILNICGIFIVFSFTLIYGSTLFPFDSRLNQFSYCNITK